MSASHRDDKLGLGPEFAALTAGAAVASLCSNCHRPPSPGRRAMNLKYLFFAAPALVTSACHFVSTDASLIDPTLHLARTCPDGVKLYTVPDRVQRPYREVALLSSVGKTSYSS